MDSIDLSSLSRDELIATITEERAKYANLVSVMNKLREHKHNYAGDFGIVVSTPLRSLMKEMLSNPEAFTQEERDTIFRYYDLSTELRGSYEILGWSIDEQLSRIKDPLIPQLEKNAELFKSIAGSDIQFKDTLLQRKLGMALSETEAFIVHLLKIESIDYGSPDPFPLFDVVEAVFDRENENKGCLGHEPIMVETTNKWRFDETNVFLNKDGFCKYFLGNIIKNLEYHAFKDFDKKVKKVRISVWEDESDSHRINLMIENNGHPFFGDTDKVFEARIGDGSGIGLHSARQYLEHFDSTIKMETRNDPDEEYKVLFKINLPKYEV